MKRFSADLSLVAGFRPGNIRVLAAVFSCPFLAARGGSPASLKLRQLLRKLAPYGPETYTASILWGFSSLKPLRSKSRLSLSETLRSLEGADEMRPYVAARHEVEPYSALHGATPALTLSASVGELRGTSRVTGGE